MPTAAVNRVLRRLDADRPLYGLDALKPSEWRTLELALAAARAGRPLAELRRRYRDAAVFAPCPADPRVLHALDGLVLRSLPEPFEPIELSPVQPLGASHVLASTPQHNVLSATRAAEVSGDPTAGLALEAVERDGDVHLATQARAVRMQPLTDPTHTAHFRLVALVSGGRTKGSDEPELSFLRDHVDFYLRWLSACRDAGFRIGALRVRLTDFEAVRGLCSQIGETLGDHWEAARARLQERGVELPVAQWADGWSLPTLPGPLAHRASAVGHDVCRPLAARYPDVRFRLDLGRLRQATYYTSLGFHIEVELPVGVVALCDGGFVDWSQRLLNDRKHRLLTSGGGLELLARLAAP